MAIELLALPMKLNIVNLLLLAFLIFAVELVFFFVPGISLSGLLIAMSALHYGFFLTFIVAIIPITAAHFLLIKRPTVFIADIMTIIPMIIFAVSLGPTLIGLSKFWGWGIFGALFSVVKWGVALPLGYALGSNIAKRMREILLEPIGSFFVFKLNFVFAFLFAGSLLRF